MVIGSADSLGDGHVFLLTGTPRGISECYTIGEPGGLRVDRGLDGPQGASRGCWVRVCWSHGWPHRETPGGRRVTGWHPDRRRGRRLTFTEPPLHVDLAALAPLVGHWSGPGRGSYPTVEPFDYFEDLLYEHSGRPFLSYSQRTRAADGRPLHVEQGYLRLPEPGRVELLVVQPTGITEVDEGTLEVDASGGMRIRLRSRMVGLSSTSKPVSRVERTFTLADSGVLGTTLAMAAVGVDLTHHLASDLRRLPTSDPLS